MTEILPSVAYIKRPPAEAPGGSRPDRESVRDLEVCGSAEAGRRVWALLDSPQTLESLGRVIVREFGIEPGSCAGGLRGLMAALLQQDLIQISPDA